MCQTTNEQIQNHGAEYLRSRGSRIGIALVNLSVRNTHILLSSDALPALSKFSQDKAVNEIEYSGESLAYFRRDFRSNDFKSSADMLEAALPPAKFQS